MIGLISICLAAIAAIVLLVRAGRRPVGGNVNPTLTIAKAVGVLGVLAVLLAAKLFPLALMLVVATGGISAIEVWRARQIGGQMKSTAPGAEPSAAPAKSPLVLRAEEAALILGVSAEATADEIRAAHRRLISAMHPDRGGSDYLAAKINSARDVMLKQLPPPN